VLWSPEHPFPGPEEMPAVPGIRSVVVHEPDETYRFLHDCTVAAHGDTLFAAWYNCPLKEMVDASVIRGRRSVDGGRTWSETEVISADPAGQFMHVPAVLYSHSGVLYAWALEMSDAGLPAGLLVYRLNDRGAWVLHGRVAHRFLPNCAPILLADGSFLMAGRTAISDSERPLHPAVAISRGSDLLGEWDVVPLAPDAGPVDCPETTVFGSDGTLVAIVRPGDWVRGDPGRFALVSQSRDLGRTWTPLVESNFPMQPSKAYAGTLSTGPHYLISNSPGRGGGGRDLLTLAVSRPGEKEFCQIWRLQDGYCEELACGPEWSYPFAVEHDRHLYVAYTSAKKHCVLSVVPVGALTAICGVPSEPLVRCRGRQADERRDGRCG
jgi:hypothetical protein